MGERDTVYIVDDDKAVRTGLENLLGSMGYRTESFSGGQEFLDSYRDNVGPGCVLLDLTMPKMDGLQTQDAIKRAGFHLPIIFLTGNADVKSTISAFKKGAIEFLEKPVDEGCLSEALLAALKKDKKNRAEIKSIGIIQTRLATLSVREFDILRHMISGERNKQIAGALGISEKTVKIHRSRVMHKMQMSSIAELVRATEKVNLIPASTST